MEQAPTGEGEKTQNFCRLNVDNLLGLVDVEEQ
jgi:hypothetical protein